MGLALRPRIAPPPVHPAVTRSPADSLVKFLIHSAAVSSCFHSALWAGPTRFWRFPLPRAGLPGHQPASCSGIQGTNSTGRNSPYRVPAGITHGQTVQQVAAAEARRHVLTLSGFERWGTGLGLFAIRQNPWGACWRRRARPECPRASYFSGRSRAPRRTSQALRTWSAQRYRSEPLVGRLTSSARRLSPPPGRTSRALGGVSRTPGRPSLPWRRTSPRRRG